MKYVGYRLNSEMLVRIFKKHRPKQIPRNLAPLDTIRFVLGSFYRSDPQAINTLDFTIQAEEYNWLTNRRVMYYPDDTDLVRAIQNSSISLTSPQAIFNGNENFILMLPRECTFDNRQASGVLVTVFNHVNGSHRAIKPFMDFLGLSVPIEPFPEETFTVTVCYQEPGELDHIYLRILLTGEMCLKLLQVESCAEWSEFMRSMNEFDYLGLSELDDKNSRYQFELIRFVLKFMIYKKALPGRIQEGLPGIHRKQVETPLTMGRTHYTVKPTGIKSADRGAHYRSWHFRQLVAERYYRGEYKDHAPGSRIVFIPDTYVNRKVEAKTVT